MVMVDTSANISGSSTETLVDSRSMDMVVACRSRVDRVTIDVSTDASVDVSVKVAHKIQS